MTAEGDMTLEPENPHEMTRAEHQAAQARAFDMIGERYDEAFPHKDGQLAAGEWLCTRLAPGSRVLDAGCGTGLPTAEQLVDAGHEVLGIDISEGMLELARRGVPDAEFRSLDLADVGPDLGTFDAVVAFFALLMLPRTEIPDVLGRLREVLRPGGYFMLSMVEADLDDIPISFLGSPVWVTGYLRDELREVVEKAGFEVLERHSLSYAPASTEAPPEVQLFLYCRRGDGDA
jgi:cyclopropane fatty-acyl-phospholipid synthase-like methyltransferase